MKFLIRYEFHFQIFSIFSHFSLLQSQSSRREAATDGIAEIPFVNEDFGSVSTPSSPPRSPDGLSSSGGKGGLLRRCHSQELDFSDHPSPAFSAWRPLSHNKTTNGSPADNSDNSQTSLGELSTIALTASTIDTTGDSWENSVGNITNPENVAFSANNHSNRNNTPRDTTKTNINHNSSEHRSHKSKGRSIWQKWRRQGGEQTKMSTSTGVPLITTLGCTASGLAPIPISVSDVDVELDLPMSPFGSSCLSPPLGQGLSSSASSLNRLCVPGQGLSHSAPGSPRERKLSLPSSLHQRRPSLSGYAAAAEHARENARLRKLSSVGASMSHR